MSDPAHPSFLHERLVAMTGATRIVGVDEVGRGPLCGPVTAAAVWLNPEAVPEGINDSKKLRPKVRGMIAEALRECADVSVAHATVEEIDALNILHATHLAMRRAIAGLAVPPDHLLVDGNRLPKDLPCPATPLVKGDTKSLSIAAASVVAKVARDQIMQDLAQAYPGYGWETNAGYPTRAHIVALKSLGVTPHHRRSFRPVHNILCGSTE